MRSSPSRASATNSSSGSSATRRIMRAPRLGEELAMGKTLYEKVFERHAVATLPSGHQQLFMGLHLLHEVTSPQAFSSLHERGLTVAYPERTFATADHIIPTHTKLRPLQDSLAEEMLGALETNVTKHGIR